MSREAVRKSRVMWRLYIFFFERAIGTKVMSNTLQNIRLRSAVRIGANGQFFRALDNRGRPFLTPYYEAGVGHRSRKEDRSCDR